METCRSTSMLLGAREVRFLNRQETRFPNLLRLCMDFSFKVLETASHSSQRHFVLVTDDYRDTDIEPIAPACSSLHELDTYVERNMVDILHDYLFGFVEEDLKMAERIAR